MNPLKHAARALVYRIPRAQAFWIKVNKVFGPGPEFSGWGMETDAYTPWSAGGSDETAGDFRRAHDELVAAVHAGRVVLTQFAESQDLERTLRELMWRHYVIFWSVRQAAAATSVPVKGLVECGVCDGLSSWFAMSALAGRVPFASHLYDAWQAMQTEQLLESERMRAGAYGYLSVDNARRNLERFADRATLVKGFIPAVFAASAVPRDVVWLHIDLNAAQATAAALEQFVDGMPAGSVVLLDDYGWRGFEDTRVVADRFFASRPGALLPLPTGQAMFLKQ